MSDIHFNKNAGRPDKPAYRSDGYEDVFEDISSFSENYAFDEYEDISSGRDMFADDYDDYGGIPVSKKSDGKKSQIRDPRYVSDAGKDISSSNGRKGKKRKKGSRTSRFLKRTLIAVFAVICVLGILAFSFVNKINNSSSVTHDNPYISDSELYSDENVMNILLLGVDAREGETVSRSDTMMLISIDKNNEKIKLTSFLRDSYVDIPGVGWNKLNAACAKGGVDLVWNTIEYNFKIKIDNYMMVDFQAFEKLIDALGGVDVEVTEKEATYLNKTWFMWSLTGNELHFDSGEAVHLNGEEALMFCRIRKLDSDFYRTERQRRTISAVKQELMRTNPMELMDIANNVLPLVETDISSANIMSLCLKAVTSYLQYDMESMGIPADGTWHSERKACGDSLVFSIDENSQIVKKYIYQ